MTDFVLDASTALAWFFEDEVSEFGERILDLLVIDWAIVPAVQWELEVANAIVKGERRARSMTMSAAQVRSLIRNLNIREEAAGKGLEVVFDLARKHQLTTYDAAYLELAMRLELPIATEDLALQEAAKRDGVPLLYPTKREPSLA